MAEIIFRLPSKVIKYGYVEVKGTPGEFGIPDLASANAIGLVYVAYVGAFLTGEKEGMDLFLQKADEKPAEGQPGTTEAASSETADELIRRELGAVEISEETHPEQTPQEIADAEAVIGSNAPDGVQYTAMELLDAPWKKAAPQAQRKPWQDADW